MKITHIITRMILGGAQENTLLTCRGQYRDGHDVTLITGPSAGPEGRLISTAVKDGFRTIIIDELVRPIAPRLDAKAADKLDKILRELKPDIVHTHSSKAGILGRKAAAKIAASKIVHTIHGLAYHRYNSWWRNRFYIALEKSAALRCDAIISVADAMTTQALAAGVGRPEQYTTIYSGMETQPYLKHSGDAAEFKKSLNLPDGAVLVTQVSRLAELKGHEFIIAAAEKIRDPRIIFCLVGDGHWRGRIERAIRRRGLASRFRLTGLLPPSQIPTVMHATDVLIHCSLREGLARTLPQGMLTGKPVISFDIDGAREVVDASTGILLPPKDTAGLVEGIAVLADHPQLRDELGAAGRQRCKTKFDWRTMVNQIQKVYQRIPE